VLAALADLFRAMARPAPPLPAALLPPPAASSSSSSSSSAQPRAASAPDAARAWLASAATLQTALAAAAARAAPAAPPHLLAAGEMQDAAEVLESLLLALHRAEAAGADPFSARRVRLPAGGAGSASSPLLAPTAPPPAPRSLAHAVMGLDVQQPLEEPPAAAGAAASPLASPPSSSAGGGGGGGLAALPVPPLAAAAPSSPSAPAEALRYTKFVHLVPAAALREAAAALPAGAPPEEALASAGAPLLARLPRVLTLGIVWESPAVPARALAATIDALPVALRTLGGGPGGGPRSLFAWSPPPPPPPPAPAGGGGGYALRALVCYHGRHYVTFAACEHPAVRAWVALDDGRAEAVGAWPAVCARLKARGLQPCLAFYCAHNGAC
jgi:hypothetical protein